MTEEQLRLLFRGVTYAGYPLILDNGSCVGTIYVLDTRPRHFDNVGLDRLRDMSEIVVRELKVTK